MKQTCNRCVMDSDVPDITFNEEGNCNYCEEFLAMIERTLQPDPVKRQVKLDLFVDQVKRDGKGKEYDCIIGLSGGVDSAWVLYQAKKMGLRPLAVHMDNGWNSELAQSNIEGLVRTLDVPLYTHVINWNEYRKLMQAFFDADVVDVELLYDNAMLGLNYKVAKKFGIKWILAGTNKATEGMRMPPGWNWMKFDKKNILSIANASGIDSLKTYTAIGVLDYVYMQYIRKYRWVSFLDMVDYNKEDALKTLTEKCEYRPYPYKHYESIFTRFYQGYILPCKFHIDKRKLHFSTLIVAGQMKRDIAIEILKKSPMVEDELERDKSYFLKKMNWRESDLSAYLNRPAVSHDMYKTELSRWKNLSKVYKILNKIS